GDFSIDAAAIVLDEGLRETIELLDRLRSNAVLQALPTGAPRFSLLESIRLYARRELLVLDPNGDTFRLHGAHFVERGERALERLAKGEEQDVSGWLEAERLDVAATLRRHAEHDPALASGARIALAHLLH